MAGQQQIRQRVTNTIIKALEAGVSPWHQPWSPARNTGFAANVVTERRYSGVNPLLLQLAALERGFQSRWWGSFEDWSSLGGRVRGWGTMIVLRQRQTTRRLLCKQVVFNADQVEGVPQCQVQPPAVEVQHDFGPADRIIAATAADIRENEGDKAWYHYPPEDYIELPSKVDFVIGMGGVKAWYDTVLHELCHWAEPRLAWNGGYLLNELRAEMGAGFLSAAIGIPSYGPTRHHFNLVDSWVDALRQDHRTIFRVSSAASAAVAFILSFSRKPVSR